MTLKSIIKTNQSSYKYQPQPAKLRELDYLTVCYYRGLITDPREQKYLARLKAGDDGEVDLVDFLVKRLPTNWQILRNVWLEIDGNKTEIDILIITPKLWWVLEVKNYRGHFEYRNQLCYLNQEHFPDQIAACRNRLRIIKRIAAKRLTSKPDIHCTIVFVNERCQVTADTQTDIQLIMRYQLPWHLDEIIQRHHAQPNSIQLQDSLTVLQRHEITHPYLPQYPNPDALELATKGIRCHNCHSFDSQITHRQITCLTCYQTISKTQAVLQSACEIGVLHYTNPKILTTANLYEFTAGKLSQKGIRLILKKYLPKHGIKHGTYYANYALPYEQVKDRFKLT